MKNFKKIVAVAAVLALALGIATGCSKKSDDKTITVAASPSPHAEILEAVKDALAEEGYTLEIKEFEDYVKPNEAVTEGSVDANYFQHQPYLDQYNEEKGTDIVSVGGVHFEAMGIYKGKKSSIAELSAGDQIGVPNDVTNEARALQLLAANGVITLKDGVGLEATKQDIVSNPYGVEIVELEAAAIPSKKADFALAVINGNYALGAGLTSDDAIVYESTDSEAATTYVNIIACAKENKDSAKIKALVKALQSDTVKNFIAEKYKGAVVAKF